MKADVLHGALHQVRDHFAAENQNQSTFHVENKLSSKYKYLEFKSMTLLKDLKLGMPLLLSHCAVLHGTLGFTTNLTGLIHHCTVHVWLLMAGFVLL